MIYVFYWLMRGAQFLYIVTKTKYCFAAIGTQAGARQTVY